MPNKTVKFHESVVDPDIKRTCMCQGCPFCKDKLNKESMYCFIFGKYRCEECDEYRCSDCLYTHVVTLCNYCKRIV